LNNWKKTLGGWLFFKEPKKVETFILREDEFDKPDKEKDPGEGKPAGSREETEMKGPGKKRKNETFLLKKTQGQASREEKSERGQEKDKEKKENPQKEEKSEITPELVRNLDFMKKKYFIPSNGDVMIREFKITFKDKVIDAFMIFIDGMTDRKVINDNILAPLMVFSNMDIKGNDELKQFISNRLTPHNQIKIVEKYSDVIDEINFGGCTIFVEGVDAAFTADVKGWEHRGVNRPNTEQTLRGPQEAFIASLRTNTALVRKIVRDEDLVVENVAVGMRSKTPCNILYIKDIANDSLVAEIRTRLKSIKVDYLRDSGELEQMIEDNPYNPTPQLIATERPDRVASMLTDGKVGVAVSGSPFVLMMPITSTDLLHSAEDNFIRFPYAMMLRIVRIISIFFSLLLPGVYLAITNFHQEMIPTDLLFAIGAARERVPFPTLVEILIMEFAFELIREAGIRIPGPIGPTLGIIGALILGQAAVAANIVSPILIIIVAVTGIGNFASPNFSQGFAFRIMRFGFIFMGSLSGFLGITTGLFILGLVLCHSKSFGVPFVSPFAPKTRGSFAADVLKLPLWKMESRPDYLNPKDRYRQPKISRGWTQRGEGEDDDDGE
jgi:spore germination protein KA